MTAAPVIRPATLSDVPALTRLVHDLGYSGGEAQVEARLRRILADSEHAVFVAETAGSVQGWLQVSVTKILESDPRADIVGLVVSPDCRRQGVGKLLVNAAERWAGRHGVAVVAVRCNQTRTEAHRFYERLGFQLAKTQLNFRKPV